MTLPILSEKTVHDFQRDGATIIRGEFREWVDILCRGIEKNIAEPGPFVRDYHDKDEDNKKCGRFFGDYCNWDRIDEYKQFLFDSPAADIAAQLMDSNEVRLFHEHVLVKEPATDIPTPWHHDQPYYCVNGKQNCSIWVALDSVDKATSVEFIAGSHKWEKWFRPERFDRSPLFKDDMMESLPDIEANRDQYNIISWATEPGDAVAFHYMTLHGAPSNISSQTRRRAFSSRWIGADTTFAVRQGKTSPPFPDVKLNHGDPLTGPEFPVVRPR